MNDIKKNMYMITGAWGSGRNLKVENNFSGDFYKDDRWPKARRIYHHPDNCYSSWPNIIANQINASIHWVGAEYNHTTNSLTSLDHFWRATQWRELEEKSQQDHINFYFVCLNGVFDLADNVKIEKNSDFWTNFHAVNGMFTKSLRQFRIGWTAFKKIIKQANYNNRIIFLIQDKETIDRDFRHSIIPDNLSIDDHIGKLTGEQEYTYFCRRPLDELVQRKWLLKAKAYHEQNPFKGDTLSEKQQDVLGNNICSWLTNNTNCFIM